MTCGECRHLRKIEREEDGYICIVQIPFWLQDRVGRKCYLSPDTDTERCGCFERKEPVMAPPPPGWPGLNKGFVRKEDL